MPFEDRQIHCVYSYNLTCFVSLDGGDGCYVTFSCLLARSRKAMANHVNVFSMCIQEQSHSGH